MAHHDIINAKHLILYVIVQKVGNRYLVILRCMGFMIAYHYIGYPLKKIKEWVGHTHYMALELWRNLLHMHLRHTHG
jgi:hypothetical protein